MKKNFKKIIFGVSLMACLLALPLFVNEDSSVKAAPTGCTDHTNYYIFTQADTWWYPNGDTTASADWQSVYATSYPIELPAGADTSVSNASFSWINIGESDDSTHWSKSKFWQIIEAGANYSSIYKKSSNEWYYFHSQEWFQVNENGGIVSDHNINPMSYKSTGALNETTFTGAIASDPTSGGQTPQQVWNGAYDDGQPVGSTISFQVKRSYSASQWNSLMNSQRQKYTENNHPTQTWYWMPAVLKVTFPVCTGEQPPEQTPEQPPVEDDTKYKLTVKYVEDGTNTELKNPYDAGEFAEGENYSVDCDSTIDDYGLSSQPTLSGTMPARDHVVYCKYKKGEEPVVPTFKVTVNYLDKNTREPLKNPQVTGNLKNGDNYAVDCVDHIGEKFIKDSYEGNLTGNIQSEDVVVNCLYVTEPVQTSDIPIFLVWAVGGATLGYSIYYFRKYYKKSNNA